ncbi:MAG TPA: DoxX family protein [Vicinamibacterales bacterium]
MTITAQTGLTILRAGTAAIMIIHGVARAWLGIVDDFGVVLNQWGFPMGFALAWTITIVEIVGGAILAAGFFVLPLSAWFAFQLLMGIYLIHSRVGWFVVGAGRNGMEFSVFLLLCLAVIALTRTHAASSATRRA